MNEADLFAEVSGYITKIYVSDGAVVSKGQALYEIDGTRYNAAVQQAKASLQIAQTDLDRQKEIWPVIKYWLTKTRSLNRFMIMPYQMLLLRKHR
ncbi:biotin/lipoyl-binding protein [Sphingobacterium sp. E70]|uniref:biotin/lipoyl-binding protein n=1 Tax=Sphingobacterium sp. E70 TaxID=2853439 RepID=UPI00211BC31B|nr:biotin/lipoyl-binding protein [Sphingobacterium sp. E70]ULT24591.1 biotin/lipoyl-binding protein [Sphingobacterium sp. E70]